MTSHDLAETVADDSEPVARLTASDVFDADHTFLDAEQIAEATGVNVVTVRKWISDGQLGSAKLGRRRVVRRAELYRFIDSLFDDA